MVAWIEQVGGTKHTAYAVQRLNFAETIVRGAAIN
jgi:hypothetical protein